MTGSGEPFDKFMEVFEGIIKDAGKDIEAYNTNLREVQERHSFIINFIGIDKNDEMVEDSVAFFRFF